MEPYFIKKGNSLKFIKPHPHLKGEKIEMGVWELMNQFGVDELKELKNKYPLRNTDED
jgi:hypothetical protein